MKRRFTSWLRARPLRADAALAAGAMLAEVVLTLLVPPTRWPDRILPALAWSAVCAAPLALRRVALPVAVGGAVLTLAVPALLDLAPLTQNITFVVLTYSVAARRPIAPPLSPPPSCGCRCWRSTSSPRCRPGRSTSARPMWSSTTR